MNHSLPTAFVSRLERQFPDHAAQIIEAMHGVPRTAINYNTQKPTNQRIGEPLAWNPHGRFVDAEKQFALDPLWHAGVYYVMEPGSQSLASMLSLLSLEEGAWRVLDLCAAPGGKTTVILNHLNDQSLLVSNEIHRQRSQILLENSIKWGRSNHLVSNASPDDFTKSGASFDLIVIDAPCGGEGMFRKDHNARTEWSEENVAMCAARQEDILDAAKQLLAPDGVIIYSTCTLASAENDNQLKRLLDSGEFELLEGWDQLSFAEAGALQTECGWQFAPGLTESEGLFISAIQLKKGGKQERPAKERYQRWKGENTWFDHLDASHVFDVKGNPRFIEEERDVMVPGAAIYHLLNYKVVDYRGQREESWEKRELLTGTNAAVSDSSEEPLIGQQYTQVAYVEYLEQTMERFAEERYSKAERGFKEILLHFPYDANGLFYGGLTAFYQGDYALAAERLNDSRDLAINTFREESEFYLALAWKEMGEVEQAETLLQEIIAKNGFYVERASEVLED